VSPTVGSFPEPTDGRLLRRPANPFDGSRRPHPTANPLDGSHRPHPTAAWTVAFLPRPRGPNTLFRRGIPLPVCSSWIPKLLEGSVRQFPMFELDAYDILRPLILGPTHGDR